MVAFAVELALFCGVGAVAYELVGGGLAGWLAAAGATVAILVFWGLLIAPKARRRLTTGHAWWCRPCSASVPPTGWSHRPPWWGGFVGIAGIAVVVAQVALPQVDGDEHA